MLSRDSFDCIGVEDAVAMRLGYHPQGTVLNGLEMATPVCFRDSRGRSAGFRLRSTPEGGRCTAGRNTPSHHEERRSAPYDEYAEADADDGEVDSRSNGGREDGII